MLRFNANLYRLATVCRAKDDTRFYLQGVFVEPHPIKGVTLTATDGHRLISIYDESGHANESAIIALTSEALKACKPNKKDAWSTLEGYGRFVVVKRLNATVYEGAIANGELSLGAAVAVSTNCRVDGALPDWRRVIPQGEVTLKDATIPGAFQGTYVADFGKLTDDLAVHFGLNKKVAMRIHCANATSPALILWPDTPQAFGVLMPIRVDDSRRSVPEWIAAKAPALQAAE